MAPLSSDTINLTHPDDLFQKIETVSKAILARDYATVQTFSREALDKDMTCVIEEYLSDYPNPLYPWSQELGKGMRRATQIIDLGNRIFQIEAPFAERVDGAYDASEMMLICEYDDNTKAFDFLRVQPL